MSVQNNQKNNDVNGTGTSCEGPSSGRSSSGEQRGPGRNQATARRGWSKDLNVAIMECYYLSKPIDEDGKPIRGYRKRMHAIWKERQELDVTEQRICDQARMILKNGWLADLELENIKRRVFNEEDENDVDTGMMDDSNSSLREDMRENIDFKINENIEITLNGEGLSDEELKTLEGLNKVIDESMDEVITGFKRVDRKILG